MHWRHHDSRTHANLLVRGPKLERCADKMREILSKIGCPLGSWREFGCHDDANAWRKSTKEADKH